MNTDVNTVKKLLAKYYAGESTIDEEGVLRRFFEAGDVPAELEADRRVFDVSAQVEAPSWLKEAVERRIDRKMRRRAFAKRFSAVAAAIAVMVAIALPALSPRGQQPGTMTMSPEEVRQQTEMALNILVGTVDKGCKAIGESSRLTVETTSETIETIKNI